MKNLLLWLGLGLGLPRTASAEPYQPKIQHSETPKPILLPTISAPIEITAPCLGLEEVLKLAFQYQPLLKVAEARVRSMHGRTEQVDAALYPHFNLSSNYIQAQLIAAPPGTRAEFLIPQGFIQNATVQQLLFDFGHSSHLGRSQHSLELSAAASLQQLKDDLAMQVKQAYYGVLQARELVRVQEESLVSRYTHVKQAKAKFTAGLGLPSDVTRAETAVSNTLYQLSTAQTNFSARRLELNLLIGLDPRVSFDLRYENAPSRNLLSTDKLFEAALRSRPEIRLYQARLDSAQAALDAAHTQNAPSLSSSLQYQHRQNPSIVAIGLNLTLNFDLLDGGLQAGQIKEAEATVVQAKAELEAARLRVLNQVGQAYLQLKNADQQVKSAMAEEANALESRRLAEGRYKVGLGVLLDVLDAQTALLNAQVNLINAQSQLATSWAALDRALGPKTTEEVFQPQSSTTSISTGGAP